MIYRTARKLSSSKVYCNLFEIIPVVDSINGIVQAVIICHTHLLILEVCIYLELLGDGAVMVVTAVNCYIY